jgi:hypothetical protein
MSGRPHAIAVLGMHRSGTSLTAQILTALGVWFGDVREMLPPDPTNPDGFFERFEIWRVNEALLGTLGMSWYQPRLPPPGWATFPEVLPFRAP